MAGFFHFLPGAKLSDVCVNGDAGGGALNWQGLARWPVRTLLFDCRRSADDVIVVEIPEGPDKGPGVILYPKQPAESRAPLLGHSPETRTWTNVFCTSSATQSVRWIGWDTAAPPGPEDLLRRVATGTRTVEDDHGQRWLVPTARSRDAKYGRLPCAFTFRAGVGQPVARLKDAYRRLWELSGDVWDYYNPGRRDSPDGENPAGSPAREIDGDDLIGIAAEALCANYRITQPEFAALQECGRNPLDTDFVRAVCFCLIDFDFLDDFKKKEKPESGPEMPAGTNSPAGTPDAGQHTGQPAVN